MVEAPPPLRRLELFVMLLAVCLFGVVEFAVAQNNQTQASTDFAEVRALNSIFQQWGISANRSQWNISGEPCSRDAIDPNIDLGFMYTERNPFIKCNCTYESNTLCHITQLKVYRMNVVGVLPDELYTLTYLTHVILNKNYLTGSISPSIGNLTRLQILNVGVNALSGELPRELGMLSEMTNLVIGSNNFSGTLPSELSSLTNLQEIWIDSAGITGEIPPSFANLRNMRLLWASDIQLIGRIPEFIGNWIQLTTLRFQGNAFHGPIPSSFSNLTSLQELRISDLSNGSSSLAFIREMRSLSVLELRNNNISDSIPSNIGEYQNLRKLDLSFNNINGQIPDALFNLSLLTDVFLGNNKLNGTLPALKTSTLLNIDVSYNNLAGSFPSWINEGNLQLNLVANNFTIEGSNSSLPSGLACLQRNFPCNRGSGIYSNFGVNCAGPQITSSSGLVFERDSGPLGPTASFVTDRRGWGFSNVGSFAGSSNLQYTVTDLSQFTNTLDSEIFQTARLSASSLRYYGLGLENGNYTVILHFAETVISDTRTWESLGRRIFDVYVQKNRVLRDFNIMREAGGVSRRAVERKFTAQVTENYIEVHLFWAGKGTCCIPQPGTYGPLISAISATPDFNPTVSNNPPSTRENRTGMIGGIFVGVVVVILLSVLVVFYILKRRKQLADEDEELIELDAKPYMFSYAELKTATEDFSSGNKLGEGGFGPVYKGKLSDGREMTVKQLSVASRQGKSQFVAEIATISEVQHRNLVRLYGCCIAGTKKLLVYEYLENKSLDQALFEKNSLKLDWPIRFDICLGVAKGLAYLHEESRLRIIHRDVKASNILLDANLVPKISDFGLAKLYDDKKTHISTRVAGTIGYLSPEYAMRGHLTEKTDVFAFGVVALEVVSGRANSDTSLEEDKIYLLEWAWNLHENNQEFELVDSRLSEFNEDEVKRLIRVALLCTQTMLSLRPPMSRVVAMLFGDIEVPQVTSRPVYLTDWRFDDLTTSFVSAVPVQGTDANSLINSSGTIETDPLQKNASKRALHDLIEDCGWENSH